MSVELADGEVWVEVTSHRARSRLQGAVSDLGPEHGVWPENGWPYGEYYALETDVAKALSIPGVKVRKIAPKGRIFQRWSTKK